MALATAVATYILLLAGGLVHSTGSGLACPDWPLCYGQFFPPMVGNIRFEHSHRLIAATVGILTAVTAALVWKNERPSLRPLVILAVFAVFVQILLGGMTVIYRLPDLVSTAHLAVGAAFFSLLVILCVRTAPDAVPSASAKPRPVVLTAAVLTYLQMVLGAFVRHTESGLACPGIPDCQGAWMPPVNTPAGLHMLHRYGSLAVLAAAAWVWLAFRPFPRLRTWAGTAVAIAILQIFVGLLSVVTKLSLGSVMIHQGLAVLLLMSFVVLSARTCVPGGQPVFQRRGETPGWCGQ